MGLNEVDIIYQDGNGGETPNSDHISALLFEHTAQPLDWGTTQMRSVRSVRALEALGIFKHSLLFGIVHYQVSEYFRMHDKGVVYVGFEITKTGTAETQAQKIKSYTKDNRVRQFGVFSNDHTETAKYQDLMDELQKLHIDAVCIMGVEAPIHFTSIPDLFARVHHKVNVINSGDGDNLGAAYAAALGIVYLPAVGAALGALSSSGVQESTAHVGGYNMSSGKELATPIFSNGVFLEDTLRAYLDEFQDKGWCFLRTYEGVAGTRFNDNKTATIQTSDYANLNRNRTAQKAARLVRAAVTPEISAGVDVDPITGQLSVGYIEYLKSIVGKELFGMEKKGELSGYNVIIDPLQDLFATSLIQAEIELVPIGISRGFKFTMGFKASISS